MPLDKSFFKRPTELLYRNWKELISFFVTLPLGAAKPSR
jgi:hypothetical protein